MQKEGGRECGSKEGRRKKAGKKNENKKTALLISLCIRKTQKKKKRKKKKLVIAKESGCELVGLPLLGALPTEINEHSQAESNQ